MTRSSALAVALLFAAGLAATLVARAGACECTAPLQLDLMVARSSTVFTGTVIAESIQDIAPQLKSLTPAELSPRGALRFSRQERAHADVKGH